MSSGPKGLELAHEEVVNLALVLEWMSVTKLDGHCVEIWPCVAWKRHGHNFPPMRPSSLFNGRLYGSHEGNITRVGGGAHHDDLDLIHCA